MKSKIGLVITLAFGSTAIASNAAIENNVENAKEVYLQMPTKIKTHTTATGKVLFFEKTITSEIASEEILNPYRPQSGPKREVIGELVQESVQSCWHHVESEAYECETLNPSYVRYFNFR